MSFPTEMFVMIVPGCPEGEALDKDAGSTLYFSLDRSGPEAQPAGAAEPEPEPEAEARCAGNILVIDDEETIRASTKMLLEHNGYTTLVAASGEDGIALYRRHGDEISLVILDLIMPGMSGKEVFGRLRQIDPGVKVVMASGYARNDAVPDGITGFIQKPYRLKELVKVVGQALA